MLVERLHLVVAALRDEVRKRRVLERADDRLGRTARVDHDLDRRAAAVVDRPHETLRDDAPQHLRERCADLQLLVRREEVDDAVDRLLRIDRVEGREHEVTRLRRLESRTHGLDVTHLTDEDDVRVLAHRGTQRRREVLRVLTHLALRDDRLLVLVENLDRVLDRDDVHLTVRVDEVDHRCERRRLARTRRAGDEHEAARLERKVPDDPRDAELGEARRAHADETEHHRRRPARLVGVDAESADARDRVREVRLVRPLELVDEVRRQDLREHVVGVHRREHGHLEAPETTVDTHARRGADLDVEVRGFGLDDGVEQRDDGLRRGVHARQYRPQQCST